MARGSVTPSGQASRRSRLSGSALPAAPLLRVRRDRAAVVDRAGGADADAGLRHEAAERREERRDPQQRLRVGPDAGLEQLRAANRRPAPAGRSAAASRPRRDLGTERGGETGGLLGRVGADALHGDAVRARELRAGRPGGSGSKPPRKPARPAPIRNVTDGAGSPDPLRVGGETALGLLAARDGERERGVGRDLPALLGGVGHRHEHADRGLATRERGPERRRESAGPPPRCRARARGRTPRAGRAGARARRRSRTAARAGRGATRARSARAPLLRDPSRRGTLSRGSRGPRRGPPPPAVQRADLDHGADLGGRVDLRDRDLVDRVLLAARPRRCSQARWNSTFARATEARIFETFSSSCSMKGFGTRKRRWRSSPGTMPWRSSASTTFSGTSSQSGLICRPSRSSSTSLHGPSRSPIDSSYSSRASMSGFHSRCVSATRARSGSTSPAAAAGRGRAARRGVPSSRGASSRSAAAPRGAGPRGSAGARPRTPSRRGRRARRSRPPCRRSPRPRRGPVATGASRPRARSSRAGPASSSVARTRSMKTASSLTSFEPYERRCHVP